MLHGIKITKFLNLKTAVFAVCVLIAVFLYSGIAFAQLDNASLEAVGEASGLPQQDLIVTIGRIINIILGVLGVILVILIIYAGFLWTTAAGDSKKTETAKKIIRDAIIGLAIVLASFGIAQFILYMITGSLFGLTGGTITGNTPFNPFSGSLGSGIVQDHYPERNAMNIPRNTMITISFKEAIAPEDIIEDTNGNGIFGDAEDLINADNIQIGKSDELESETFMENVFGRMTEDHKTFLFDPQDVLGSPAENTKYTVIIGADIQKEAGGAAFEGSFRDGYRWEFEVGTFLDLTPPQILSVIPRADATEPRNITVQINFNEAVDPTASSGSVEVREDGSIAGFRNIEIRAGENIVPGKFYIGNGYKTVEFQTNDLCGMNSCGGEVYCLPGNSDITARVRAATVGSTPPTATGFPYDGVVDMSANSLDGNRNNTAEGQPDDNYSWAFRTNNTIDLRPPTVTQITPDIEEGAVALDAPIRITFSKLMSATTLNNSNISLMCSQIYEYSYVIRSDNLAESGEPAEGDMTPVNTRAEIRHGGLAASTGEIRFDYFPGVNSNVKDLYQNCYYPGVGGICEATPSLPFCCNGIPSATVCPYLPTL
jgi:hypothetical protein